MKIFKSIILMITVHMLSLSGLLALGMNENLFQDTSNLKKQGSLQTSENVFSPEQDTTYNKLMKARIPANVILRNNLKFSDKIWHLEKKMMSGTPLQEALENIRNMPREYSIPLPTEVVQRQIAIENSQYVPFLNSIPRYGLKIPFSAIGSLLGLVEDVSPVITYRLDYTTDVQVVIYSVKASVVATLFSGIQTPGKYTFKWNGRDDSGKLLDEGDYISEVRIGKDYLIRKRIIITY